MRKRPGALPYLFVAPTVVLTVLFSVVPLVMLAYRSLMKGDIFDQHLRFVGLRNYTSMLPAGGWHSLVVTAKYTVGFVLASMVLGLLIAMLLNSTARGVSRFRAPFVIPLVVPAVATALIWANLFAPQFGLVNRILSAVGLPQVDFLSAPTPALVTVVLFGTWQYFGQAVILYLAALKSIPREVTEAAAVDGASRGQLFRRIQWPLLNRDTTVIGVVTTLTGLQTFTQIYVLTQGGPQGATQTALYYVYNEGFVRFDGGRAAAMGVVLFVLSIAITVVQVRMLRRERS